MEDTSKLSPLEFAVLVKPDKVSDQTSGGIWVPLEARERQQYAEVKSTVVACGGNAFSDWKPPIPKIGDRVYVAKYAGLMVRGEDGDSYRIVSDKDCKCLILGETSVIE